VTVYDETPSWNNASLGLRPENFGRLFASMELSFAIKVKFHAGRSLKVMEQRTSQSTAPRIVNPYVEESNSKAGRFLTLSVFVHAALVATVSLMSFPPTEISKPDLVEIEMMGDSGPANSEAMVAQGSASPLDNSQAADAADTTATAAPMPAPPPPAQAAAPAALPPPPTSAPIAKVAQAPAAPKPVAKAAVVKTSPVEAEPKIPVAMNEAQASQLETSETGEVPVSQLDEKDLQEDFERIDQNQKASLEAAKKDLEDQAAKAAAANEATLAEAKKKADAEDAAKVAAAAEARRQKDAEAIAAAKAQEKLAAAREARAQERAQAEARAREKAVADANAAAEAKAAEANAAAAAKAAAQAAAAEKGQGDGSETGTTAGTGSSESPEGTKQVAGIPGGVRTLGQLRQRPGNRTPSYDPKERLLRHEGSIVFYAYVNKDGSLSEFKMAQSTGHKNLDDKTLAALRTWKFYPGQEGWVEMPFQWSLKGEAQEAGGLLR
jgi:TonB family protein